MEVAPMKRLLLLVAIFVAGCTPQQSDQLTQQQKDQIKSEVNAVIDSILVRWQRLDVEGSLQCYSPEMIAVGDSSMIDFQAYKKVWYGMANYVASVKWTTAQFEIVVLSKDLAMSGGFGKLDLVMKSGDKVTINPKIFSNVYKKFGNEWKAIYEHGSGIPVMEKAGKK
jgi:hypothetical protein